MSVTLFLVCLTEIPLPNEQARLDILKIHAAPITKHGDIGKNAIIIIIIMVYYKIFSLPPIG